MNQLRTISRNFIFMRVHDTVLNHCSIVQITPKLILVFLVIFENLPVGRSGPYFRVLGYPTLFQIKIKMWFNDFGGFGDF